MRRMGSLAYYQELMRPHSGTSTALMCLTRAGRPFATLSLGRTHGGFNDRELAYLRSVSPALSVCEAAQLTAAAPADLYAPRSQLTAREREVLGYLPLGLTNRQIALALGRGANDDPVARHQAPEARLREPEPSSDLAPRLNSVGDRREEPRETPRIRLDGAHHGG